MSAAARSSVLPSGNSQGLLRHAADRVRIQRIYRFRAVERARIKMHGTELAKMARDLHHKFSFNSPLLFPVEMLDLFVAACIAVLVISPSAITLQIGKQMIARALEFIAVPSPNRTSQTRNVNNSLSLTVLGMTLPRWAMACADMAEA